MSLALLLDDLTERRIELRVENGRLRYKAPEGALTPELRERIGAHKEALLRHLSGQMPLEPEILRSPVSAAQERLWFVHQMQGPNYTYNIPLDLRLRGPLDRAALRAALDDLVRRHQSLRCCFEPGGETLRLAIRRDLRAPWEETDLSAVAETDRRKRLDEGVREVALHCFDLAQAPLMRARLIRLDPEEHVLALNFHHSAVDGWSIGVILQEIAAGYEARLAGRAAELPPLRWQYTDYVEWQERLRRNGTMDVDLAFWRERLAGAPDCTTLPADKRRPSVQNFAGAFVPLAIDAARTARLRAKAREWSASLNHLTLAATAILLADFSGSNDLVVGLPLANRTRRELEPIIGMFVNIVPLRLTLDPAVSFGKLVAQVKQAVTEAMTHCHLPFERLVEAISVKRDLSLSPVYQVAYNFLPPMENRTTFGGLQVEPLPISGEGISKYDCTFYLEESAGGIFGHIEYATSLYRRETVERWAQAFESILAAMLEDSGTSFGARPRFAATGRDQLEAWCAGPIVPIPEASPWTRFEEMARRAPDATALEEDGRRMSYAELARRAEIISAKLAGHGIGRGDRVGLVLPRGCDHVAAMLGVVRRGAVFVPFDGAHPRERLAMMAAQARLGAVVCRPGNPAAEVLSPVQIRIDAGTWSKRPEPPPAVHAALADPLYIIFTSGSTGGPKAVDVPWRGLCNLVQSFLRAFGVAPQERCSQIASLSFDASLFEIWPPLLGGGTLVFVPEDVKLDPEALRDWILRERIGVHFSPTPLAEELLEFDWPADTPLRLLMTGGQALHKYPRAGLPFRLSNNYGPTETSIAVTWCVVEAKPDGANLPAIGRPIDNTRIALLDPAGRRVPPGATGELWIAGAGVARGYFGHPEATARSFVTLPGDPATTWYRSGDLVRMQPGGELEFVGRADGQIKLRGHRIEPGEVENAIRRVPGVRQAAIRLEGEQLVAYVENDGTGVEEIRRQAAAMLPDYMLPAHVVALDKLPRQSSGKIDLQALPLYNPPAAIEANASETASETEAAVARAWTTVLKRPARRWDDNFFDLGGHSLMLVRLKEQIRKETGREIGILDLFRNPTIARQAAFLHHGAADTKLAPRQTARRAAPAGSIAIIGMAGRFPEADNIEAFWENLCSGRDCIRTFSREELLSAGVPPELADRPDYVPANAILRDIDRFDADFFGISAREAEVIDPQQRLLLEEAWHTFEDAGYDPACIEGRVGVFVGSSLNGYLIENVLPRRDIVEKLGGFTVLIHNDKDFAATRLSYKLDLRGPSVSVNTACSTSLVAVHQAVTALRDGQCEMALAGGACVRSRQIDGYRYEEGGVLSRDGKCRAFDAAATGMVGGNGVALVLLKPLAQALADGDHIHAVIKGIAANNDGADKVGFTAPGIRGQSLVIRDALERADVDPQAVLYVEAHGTGTQLGDSIEVAALAENYAPTGRRAPPLYLGSVKTNVGHLDAAAGAAGLIKTALCLRERMRVPSLHFRAPNPQIHWPGDGFKVCTETESFPESIKPLRAAVSSLGIGGTNVHAVLEEAPARSDGDGPATASPALLLLSGKSPKALHAQVATMADWMAQHQDARLRDVAHTLAFGRRHWESRDAVCAASAAEAAGLLAEPRPPVDQADSVAFMFTGMGPHKPGMARVLYGRSPMCKTSIDECAGILQPILGLDIREPLLASPDDAAADALLNEHRIGQPVVFAFEYALARFWMDLGISPSVLIGHSLGEWVAACLAGVFELPDALRLVSLRGGLMDGQSQGAMLAVNLGEAEVAARLPATLDIATVNARDQIVVAGPAEAVDHFAAQLEAEGIRCKRLQVTLAAHSSLMAPMLDRFRAAIADTPRHAPQPGRTVVSNLTGGYLDAEHLQSPDYWTEHLRRCVRFADGLATLWARPGLALLECGPSHTLCNLALRDARRSDHRAIAASLDGEDAPETEWRRVLETAGTLWRAGLPLDLDKLFALQGKGRRIPLPGYAFQRKRYWLDAVIMTGAEPQPASAAAAEEPDAPDPVVSNASPAEARVIAVMRELLGPVHLSRQSDFFLSGGDSLLAVRLAARVGEAFGARLTRAQIMAAKTPARIAGLLADNGAETKTADQGASCLVRLWDGDDTLTPIVLIHAVGGGIFIYRELLQALATSHPVYGLQAPGLWDEGKPIASLGEQAAHYHACLLRAGIKRPVMIAGSSYGGIVAYELDRLYRQAGHATPLVALFDSPGPGHMPQRLEGEAEICAYLLARDNPGRDFAADLGRMQALDHAGRFALLLKSMQEAGRSQATADDVERQVRVFRQNLVNMWNWAPTPHSTRLLFFKAAEHMSLLAREPERAWISLASAGLEIISVPGNHSSMLSFPHVNFLAGEIIRRLSSLPVTV
ncbi:MAG: amino acid adenylation domain-containing protein [Opitutaceae bacterium]|nr:amino acid adenylation domain-containing protein [Opitutaceae bacterium]